MFVLQLASHMIVNTLQKNCTVTELGKELVKEQGVPQSNMLLTNQIR